MPLEGIESRGEGRQGEDEIWSSEQRDEACRRRLKQGLNECRQTLTLERLTGDLSFGDGCGVQLMHGEHDVRPDGALLVMKPTR